MAVSNSRDASPSSTTRGAEARRNSSFAKASRSGGFGGAVAGSGDALSKLHPAQLREMREAFQVLDRDSDGMVTREDLVDMLTNLGEYRTDDYLI